MSRAARSGNSLAAGIAALARHEGCNGTRYPGVVVYRVTVAEPPTPTLYPSSLILVGAGEKQAILGDKAFAYNAGHYLVVTSPLPMLCRTVASAAEPVLTVVVEIELALLRELLLEEDAPPAPQPARPSRGVFRAPLRRDLEDAGARLLACLTDERRTRALARQTIREMLFLVLDGPYGDSLRALAEGPVSQLAHVLRHMNARFAERMRIGDLAQLAHMSVPTFHQHFKAMTGSSPLQYMKALRLTRARRMLHAGGMVKTVAHDVGYESESQFSREYRRFFGWPPSADSHGAPRAHRAVREADGAGGKIVLDPS
ncbi:AraC family transcriptional regulator [Sorangium cellulosum]|uniref:AraC family transcriptional regulator n=1 Tax=Sorangium cellulosum TaxID=56 RepID=A0A150SXG6_SORCE|nr:AraC family transcriptional regulator [Sorangium cellulosum]KYF97070.1 AraC family transcriptional regulator [Sorangium cellulosum]